METDFKWGRSNAVHTVKMSVVRKRAKLTGSGMSYKIGNRKTGIFLGC